VAPRRVSPKRGTPTSSYNPAISADGRTVAYEAAPGNLNFAKRYGAMGIFVADLARERVRPLSAELGDGVPRSAYNPTVSGDGRLVAYESSESRRGRVDVVLADLRTGRQAAVPAPAGSSGRLSEPRLSADGRWLAFTAAAGARSAVYLRHLRSGRVTRISAPGEEAWEPVPSADGASVAYTASHRGRARVLVRDVRAREAEAVPTPWGEGLAFEPSLAGDGRRVAFVARPLADPRSTQVFLHDRDTGALELVSRADGPAGAPGLGAASHPALSADGSRLAFTSDAWNLSPGKCNSARGIFVRDVARGRTTLVSRGDGANRATGPTKGSSTSEDWRIALLCA